MTSFNRFFIKLSLVSLAIAIPQTTTLAKSNASMKVEQAKYTKVTDQGYGPTYPAGGPIYEVYAEGSSTKYTHEANTHKNRKVHLDYTASCSNKGKLSSIQLRVGETYISHSGGGGFKSGKYWLEIPYAEMPSINAKKYCNDQAKTYSLEKNIPLEKVVQKGFVMKLPGVFEAKGTAFCNARIGKGGVKSATTKLDAWVVCKPNPKARKPRASTKTSSKSSEPGQATTNFKNASFKA